MYKHTAKQVSKPNIFFSFLAQRIDEIKESSFNRMGKDGETVVIDIRNCFVELFVTTDIADNV